MKIVLASNNKGKIKEIKELLPDFDVVGFGEILGDLDIPETGTTFAQNACIKAQTIYDLLQDKDVLVISDDSGLSVEALDFRPNIYSARFAADNATDEQNNQKLITQLQNLGLQSSPAFYTAAIAIAYQDKLYTTHGWCHGTITTLPKGSNGFGYDPLFIPQGYNKTFGELEIGVKKNLSHRAQALKLAMVVVKLYQPCYNIDTYRFKGGRECYFVKH